MRPMHYFIHISCTFLINFLLRTDISTPPQGTHTHILDLIGTGLVKCEIEYRKPQGVCTAPVDEGNMYTPSPAVVITMALLLNRFVCCACMRRHLHAVRILYSGLQRVWRLISMRNKTLNRLLATHCRLKQHSNS